MFDLFIERSDVYIKRYSRILSSSAECFQLAVLTFPTAVGDQVTVKMPLTRWRVQNPGICGVCNDKEDTFNTTKYRWVIVAGGNDCL